jgi:hypothetical protein
MSHSNHTKTKSIHKIPHANSTKTETMNNISHLKPQKDGIHVCDIPSETRAGNGDKA